MAKESKHNVSAEPPVKRSEPKESIYTDGVHIVGDTLEQLHYWCARIGIKRCWFHSHREHPHYDKPKRMPLRRLYALGARKVDSRTILHISRVAKLRMPQPWPPTLELKPLST